MNGVGTACVLTFLLHLVFCEGTLLMLQAPSIITVGGQSGDSSM